MKTTLGPVIEWLYKATAGIRFKPDRKAVRAELEEHLEDKALDFQRIFPDLTEAEARERAVSEMGDPMEIGKELAKVHRPWLGYVWRVAGAAGLAAAGLAACGGREKAAAGGEDAAPAGEDRSRCGSTTIPFGWRKRP